VAEGDRWRFLIGLIIDARADLELATNAAGTSQGLRAKCAQASRWPEKAEEPPVIYIIHRKRRFITYFWAEYVDNFTNDTALDGLRADFGVRLGEDIRMYFYRHRLSYTSALEESLVASTVLFCRIPGLFPFSRTQASAKHVWMQN